MWKSVILPVGKDLELDDPDLWIKIVPIGFLPNRVSREILAEMAGAQNIGDQDANVAGSYIEKMVKYMPAIILDWNLKDANGERIEPPSVNPQAANDLPIDVIGYVMTNGMGVDDTETVGDIPLVSNSSSESDSSETSSPAVTEPENSHSNVVALKAQMEVTPVNNP